MQSAEHILNQWKIDLCDPIVLKYIIIFQCILQYAGINYILSVIALYAYIIFHNTLKGTSV